MAWRALPSDVGSKATPGVAPQRSERLGWLALLPAAAAVLVLFAWLPALNAPYQYDDFNTPVGDAASQSLTNWWHAVPRTLRPLTKLTYALESTLGADSAPARRLLNALLFGGCLTLLKALLETVAKAPAALALLAASVWAVHPVHAETLVALAGRPVLLSLFLMLASALFIAHQRAGLALGCALLALLARESALPWLVVCAGLVAQQRGVSGTRIAVSGLAAFGVGALVLASSSGVRALVTSAFGAAGAWNHLGLQWAALSSGSARLVWSPAAFTPDMEFGPGGLVRLSLIVSTLALYAAALWVALEKPHWRLFALLWLCLVLPLHSVVPKLDVLTARPFSASFAPLLGLAACAVVPRLASGRRLAGATAVLAAAFVLLFPLTRRRAALYADPIALWSDAAERTTRSVRPLVNLGTLQAQKGELRAAEVSLTRALQREPSSVDIRLRLRKVRRASLMQLSPHEN